MNAPFTPPAKVAAFEGVTVQYYERGHIRTALHDVSLTIRGGESVAILGTKGSGKSTFIRLLANLETPMVGRVAHHNMSVSWPVWARTGLIRGMTVRDNIRFTAQLYGRSPPQVIRSVDDFVHLGRNMDVLLGALPSSTMAKVMFATAVALNFDCYPIDGWLVTHDHEFRRKAEAALQDLRSRASLVLATSRTNFVHHFCDVAYVLHQGVLTPYDTIDEAIRTFRAYSASAETA
ncbi:ATP-binding cassette domain-containing protein [Oleomonas cavernae]|uniref:ATP-binding cassette domain-containing protein n=1 Tax=Oleomonas cavernae TaxID=2320859 RepID=A0A418WTB0_9PROT|nr:ATP-binding cassette domain-containing protein [Oleomonas cavernae]RJF94490.1 ATP-binding cassette domain-containing protein [Oleomonas cavernae]